MLLNYDFQKTCIFNLVNEEDFTFPVKFVGNVWIFHSKQ